MTSSIIILGGFDGVHLGHQALVRDARRLATEHARRAPAASPMPRVCAIVLDPKPSSILRPASAPATLTSVDQREALLRAAGADDVVRINVTPEFLDLSPEEFLARHIAPLNPVAMVEGPDFRFGKNRAGDLDTVRRFFSRSVPGGFVIDTPQEVHATLTDLSFVPARSTMIRWLLLNARVRDAAILLGRPHELLGTVVPGDRRGRTIGYPTINIDSPCLSPSDGVYAGLAVLPDARVFPAAISVGVKPTFNGAARAVEAFLLNHTQRDRPWSPIDGLPEYRWPVRLQFLAFIRDQVRFPGLQSLLDQIARDCLVVHDIAQSHLAHSPRPVEASV